MNFVWTKKKEEEITKSCAKSCPITVNTDLAAKYVQTLQIINTLIGYRFLLLSLSPQVAAVYNTFVFFYHIYADCGLIYQCKI